MDLNLDQEITKAVSNLTRWPGVKRIWLFGSSVKGTKNLTKRGAQTILEVVTNHQIKVVSSET
jgi:predicted nucleotidyltransferase